MVFKTLIDVDSLQELLGRPRLAVVDCRFDLMNPEAGRQAYLRAHIPGARYADLNRDLSAPVGPHTGRHPLPQPEVFAGRLGAMGIGNDTQVVAYDEANGSIAARLWWMLRWLGHDAAAVLDGGFKAWTARGGALQSGEADPAAAERVTRHFTPRLDAGSVVSTAELERALQDPKAVLVDARAQDRYAGAVEPIDPVAGHIPGAVNHPFTANLGADGRFLPAAELKRRWQERLPGGDLENLVAMCGSGVTACHNLLSLEVAGLTGGKLYAGSWSEWIRDPRRPIARGLG
jgi:thiosulfate/3-mercaptopyruvate sulfurtransferase